MLAPVLHLWGKVFELIGVLLLPSLVILIERVRNSVLALEPITRGVPIGPRSLVRGDLVLYLQPTGFQLFRGEVSEVRILVLDVSSLRLLVEEICLFQFAHVEITHPDVVICQELIIVFIACQVGFQHFGELLFRPFVFILGQ